VKTVQQIFDVVIQAGFYGPRNGATMNIISIGGATNMCTCPVGCVGL